MNPSGSYYDGTMRSTIDPYYVKGDVFQRDSRYYDQTIQTRRNRTPNKSLIPGDPNNMNNTMPNPSINSNLIGSQTGGQSQGIAPITGTVINTLVPPSQPPVIIQNDPEELRRLREENLQLASELQQLSYGGEFGTGDVVIKKNYYTASKKQTQQIAQQELKIRQLQSIILQNNQKLIKYQKASNQLQIRMNNIQAIDKQIYKQLRTATTRDKELLQRAGQALNRGDAKDSIIRILEQIVIN